jgi:hypothetical protein
VFQKLTSFQSFSSVFGLSIGCRWNVPSVTSMDLCIWQAVKLAADHGVLAPQPTDQMFGMITLNHDNNKPLIKLADLSHCVLQEDIVSDAEVTLKVVLRTVTGSVAGFVDANWNLGSNWFSGPYADLQHCLGPLSHQVPLGLLSTFNISLHSIWYLPLTMLTL